VETIFAASLIGLTLVRRLVELHSGAVEAVSAGTGKGSEFIVRLPLIAGNSPLQVQKKDQTVEALQQGRILVVDDNLDAAESLKLLLHALVATVMSVHDGHAALDALRTWRPTVVPLDVGMPGMDGYEVSRRMRQQAQGRDTCRGDRLGPGAGSAKILRGWH
jgi:hypothetical protein